MNQAHAAPFIETCLSEATQSALPAIILDARRAAMAMVTGEHGRRRAGVGDAFWQHREWANGESVRQIDWRRSARSDKLFVREREWQVPAHLHVWCDQRPNMNWTSSRNLPTKAQRGLVLGLVLALATRQGGERALVLPSPANAQPLALREEMTFLRALATAGLAPPQAPKSGQVLLVSDGLEEVPVWQDRARMMVGAHAHLIVVLIADPAEAAFPFQGRLVMQSGTQSAPVIVGRAQDARGDYQRAYQAHLRAVKQAIEQMGGQVFSHQSDQATSPVLIGIAQALAGSR